MALAAYRGGAGCSGNCGYGDDEVGRGLLFITPSCAQFAGFRSFVTPLTFFLFFLHAYSSFSEEDGRRKDSPNPGIPMTTDKSIFGLRFKSNGDLLPAQEELKVFLAGPKNTAQGGLHGDDLGPYIELLKSVETFDPREQQGTAQALRKRMLFGVLAHSHFVRPALRSAVEQYKYHLHALAALDFKKPLAFIKSAEEEMARLNSRKKDDALKLARFQDMVEERKKTVQALNARGAALADELNNIALYIRDNLAEIEKLCESSIVVLVDIQMGRKKESELIEDIKTHFKEQLRDALHQGPVTKQYVETVKEDAALLTKQVSTLLMEDIYAMTGLYEAIHDHAKKIIRELDALTAQAADKRKNPGEGKDHFARIERVLVSLVKDHRFEIKAVEGRNETEQEKLLFEKRKEMLDHLFVLLQK
jgi:hypothetical protein